MNTLNRVAVATCIVASLSISAFALSNTFVGTSRADDTSASDSTQLTTDSRDTITRDLDSVDNSGTDAEKPNGPTSSPTESPEPTPTESATSPTEKPEQSPTSSPIGNGLDPEKPWKGGPYTTEPQATKTPVKPTSPYTGATAKPEVQRKPWTIKCAPWEEPGWLNSHGEPTGCVWAMPSDGGTIILTQCAEEDSTNCYWDATKRGNGKGRNFININGHTFYESK